jgi:hypothetical protein
MAMRTGPFFALGAVVLLVRGPVASASELERGSIDGVDYALLDIAPRPEAPATLPMNADWYVVRQIEATHERAGGRLDGALASGWIDSNTYVRIERGRVLYFTRRPNPVSTSREATHVCRITVDTAAAGLVMPDALPAFGSSSGQDCEAPPAVIVGRLKNAALWLQDHRMTGRTTMAATDGTPLTVEHRGGNNYFMPPIAEPGSVRSLYQLPTQWDLAHSTRQRVWVIERTDGTYDLAVRFDIEGKGERSGCIVRDAAGSFPSATWITPELRQWCEARDREFSPDPPANMIPRPPPPR